MREDDLFSSYKNSLDPAKSYFGHLLNEEEKEICEENTKESSELALKFMSLMFGVLKLVKAVCWR